MFKSNQIKYMDIIKRTISLFKKYYAEFIILLGVYIFISNSLDFFHYGNLKGGGLGVIRNVSYYYSATTINNIAVGVIIIVLGFLIIKNRKNKNV